MIKTPLTPSQSTAGAVRLNSRDVGFDMRALKMPVVLPVQFESAVIEDDDGLWYIAGTREEMIEAIEAAGYVVNPKET